MKCFYFSLAIIGLCLVVSAFSVPLDKQMKTGKKVTVNKQAVNNGVADIATPVAPTATVVASDSDEDLDDDDDDDDDDDGGIEEVLVDDDGEDEDDDDDDDDDDEDDDEDDVVDDDDEDEDDDAAGTEDEGEDGDYLERFFDDILGDDEEDYEDDDVSAEIASSPTPVTVAPISQDIPVVKPIKPETVITPNEIAATPSQPNVQPEAVEEVAENIIEEDEAAAPVVQNDNITKAPVYELSISQDADDGDDEDDDDFGDGVIEARSLRRSSKQSQIAHNDSTQSLPSTILARYTTVVDGVYDKLNAILKKLYDPINVQLTRQSSRRSEMKNFKKYRIRNVGALRKYKTATVNHVTKTVHHDNTDVKLKSVPSTSNKMVTPTKQSKTRARGTMYGLSTLKRKGNIHVTTENNEDTIKSDFILGPLVLKVSKSFARGAKRELRSASAMTSKLRGRIILKVNDGKTVLHTIKIQQPKNIKIEVPGKKLNRSREMAWRKSLNIAHIVADQLSTVSRTMLKL